MTLLVKKSRLTVPEAITKKAGIKPGDLVAFTVRQGTITIHASAPTNESRFSQKREQSPKVAPPTSAATSLPSTLSRIKWSLLVTGPARKSLVKLPDKDQRSILQALAAMEADPYSGDIKRLEPESWRRRVGNYRVFYDLRKDQRHIVVTAIERRTSTTY
jgi:mRNA-degrading endonuclease RelE of RelBE toxin-antitoxin system/bifunctional DNA-binding transcriptional regulator/antitoxin component of YhaV-PrlF toxin-antitoxin module